MSPSLRPVHLAVLAAVVGAGALIAWFALREPSSPAPVAADTLAPAARPSSDSDAARASLARGNEAFRAGDYAEALVQYRTAARTAPSSAAPQYGIHMAARKLDDAPLADSALAAIRRLVDTTAGLRDGTPPPAPVDTGGHR